MLRLHRFFWAGISAVGMALATVAVAAEGQDPTRPAEGPAARDPFDVAEKPSGAASEKKAEKKAAPEPEFVRKSELEWRRILPPAVFAVARMKATEPAFSGKYATGHFRGMFVCACCEAELFSSQHKFESGTGWPSFWRPIRDAAIDRAPDYNEAEPRVEVMCHRCGAHLGHVFGDGPPPTGLRFCINSLSLKLKSTEGDAARPAPAKAASKAKVRTTRARSGSRPSRSKVTAKAAGPDSPAPSGEPTATDSAGGA